jgi:hypothetical protein
MNEGQEEAGDVTPVSQNKRRTWQPPAWPGVLGQILVPFVMALGFAMTPDTGDGGIPVLTGVLGLYVVAQWLYRLVKGGFPRSRTLTLSFVWMVVLSLPIYAAMFIWLLATGDGSDCSANPGTQNECSFSEPLTKVDALYFTVTTMTTTGYGDIHPVSQQGRMLVTGVQAGAFLFIVVGVALFFERRQRPG